MRIRRAGSNRRELKRDSGEEKIPKTLPYFVAERIIIALQIVCQEKNGILEQISVRRMHFFEMAFYPNYAAIAVVISPAHR